MSVYINLLPYTNNMETSEELMKKWGGGIELITEGADWGNHPSDWSKSIDRFKTFTGALSVHTPIFELNLATPRYRVISEYSFEVYQQSLHWAAEIGANHAVVHPNLYSTPIYHRTDAQQCSKEYLKKLGELGNRLGVKVLVENVGFHDTVLFHSEEFVRLFDEIPTIDPLLDVGHAHINGWDTPAIIRQLGERLAAVHLHDNHGNSDEHLPIGEGTIAWAPVWEALDALHREVDLILEYNIGTPSELLLKHAKKLQDNVRALGLVR